jgi:hypothetical protein
MYAWDYCIRNPQLRSLKYSKAIVQCPNIQRLSCVSHDFVITRMKHHIHPTETVSDVFSNYVSLFRAFAGHKNCGMLLQVQMSERVASLPLSSVPVHCQPRARQRAHFTNKSTQGAR